MLPTFFGDGQINMAHSPKKKSKKKRHKYESCAKKRVERNKIIFFIEVKLYLSQNFCSIEDGLFHKRFFLSFFS
jgi:hypothetical protein